MLTMAHYTVPNTTDRHSPQYSLLTDTVPNTTDRHSPQNSLLTDTVLTFTGIPFKHQVNSVDGPRLA